MSGDSESDVIGSSWSFKGWTGDFHPSDTVSSTRYSNTCRSSFRCSSLTKATVTEVHENNATLLHTLGTSFLHLSMYDRARSLLEESLAMRRSALSEEDPLTLAAAHDLARCLTQRGALPEALELYDALLPIAVQVLPVSDRTLPLFRMGRGIVLTQLGRLDEAEAELELSLSACQEYFGPDNSHTRMAAAAMAALAQARGGLGE